MLPLPPPSLHEVQVKKKRKKKKEFQRNQNLVFLLMANQVWKWIRYTRGGKHYTINESSHGNARCSRSSTLGLSSRIFSWTQGHEHAFPVSHDSAMKTQHCLLQTGHLFSFVSILTQAETRSTKSPLSGDWFKSAGYKIGQPKSVDIWTYCFHPLLPHPQK